MRVYKVWYCVCVTQFCCHRHGHFAFNSTQSPSHYPRRLRRLVVSFSLHLSPLLPFIIEPNPPGTCTLLCNLGLACGESDVVSVEGLTAHPLCPLRVSTRVPQHPDENESQPSPLRHQPIHWDEQEPAANESFVSVLGFRSCRKNNKKTPKARVVACRAE